ncbi:MAG: hypothetical protein AAGL17_08785, partial [Cyanobacteria bacterium J06576_12]
MELLEAQTQPEGLQYSESDLKAAAIRAHNAGDIAAARRLVMAARNAASQQSPTVGQPAMSPLPNSSPLAGDNPTPVSSTASLPSLTPGVQANGQGAAMNIGARGRRANRADTPAASHPGIFQTLRDNIIGDDDDTTMNFGERLGAALNKGGESMTMGLVGDEMAGRADALIGRGTAEDRTQFYRDQENQLDEQHPVLSTTAAITGAIIGPAKGATGFVNAGRNAGTRVGRGAMVGAGAGATYGAMEGETAEERLTGGLVGGTMGAVTGGALTGAGQGFSAAAQRLTGKPQAQEVLPTLQSLTDEARGLYAAAERAGGVVSQQSIAGLTKNTQSALREAGYNPRLHPRMGAVLDEMQELSTGPASLRAMDQLRRVAGNAAESLQRDERRLGRLVIGRIDEAVEQMDGGAEVAAAREVWGRLQRMATIEGVIEKASNSPNFETTLATGFRSLLNRKGALRGFRDEEIRTMRQIASGGGGAGTLRALGNILAPDRFSGQMLTGGALLGGGGIGALAIPAAGATMRGAGNRLQRRSADGLRNSVGQSDA